MPLPRARFTVRRLMVAVVIFAMAAGGWRWYAATRRREREYSDWAWRYGFLERGARDEARRSQRRYAYTDIKLRYFEAMRLKYERAARCPWFPVEPDPPEPEPDPNEPEPPPPPTIYDMPLPPPLPVAPDPPEPE
jgi:hypothetical protein